MPILKAPPTTRCINYAKNERTIFYKIEETMCKEMGLKISELHKEAIRRMWNARQNQKTFLGVE